jgi:anti-anti-sigma factor
MTSNETGGRMSDLEQQVASDPVLRAVPVPVPRLGVLPAPLHCTTRLGGLGAARVEVSGELDLAGAPELESAIREALLSAQLVMLDLRDLDFIDSAGVHVVVDESLRALVDGRRLIIAFAPANVVATFALTDTTSLVEMFDLDPVSVEVPGLRLVPAQGRSG